MCRDGERWQDTLKLNVLLKKKPGHHEKPHNKHDATRSNADEHLSQPITQTKHVQKPKKHGKRMIMHQDGRQQTQTIKQSNKQTQKTSKLNTKEANHCTQTGELHGARHNHAHNPDKATLRTPDVHRQKIYCARFWTKLSRQMIMRTNRVRVAIQTFEKFRPRLPQGIFNKQHKNQIMKPARIAVCGQLAKMLLFFAE